jgi:hypothetical protein
MSFVAYSVALALLAGGILYAGKEVAGSAKPEVQAPLQLRSMASAADARQFLPQLGAPLRRGNLHTRDQKVAGI